MIGTILSILILGTMVSFMYMLISTGFTLIYSVSNILDLSYPFFLVIGGYIYIIFYSFLPPFLSLALSMILTSILYIMMFQLIVKNLLDNPIMVAVITVLSALALEYLFMIIFSRVPVIIFPIIPGVTRVSGTAFATNMLLVVAISSIVMAIFWAFLKLTFSGKAILALSMDRKGAAVVGVDLNKTLTVVYAIAGLMAGLAGVSYGAYTALSPEMWFHPLIIILAIALVGGLGSLKGTIIVSIMIGFLEVVTTYLWDPRARGISALLCIILILYIRPHGLFGKAAL